MAWDHARARLGSSRGHGAFSVQLALLGYDVIAFDIDLEAMTLGRSEGPGAVAWVGGDATRLPFAGGAFDLILCNSAIEHFPDEDAAIGEMSRVLKPGGRLIFTTDSFPPKISPWLRWWPRAWRHDGLQTGDLASAMRERHRLTHHGVRFGDPARLERCLAHCHLRLVAWRYYLNGPVSKPIFELHMVHRGLGFYNFLSRRLFPIFWPFTFPIFSRRPGYGIAVVATRE